MALEFCEDGIVGRELIAHLAFMPQLLAVGDDNEVATTALD